MSMGLPAVGYKSCSAVNELIKDGENGYLCDDGIEPLRISMKRLMSSLSIRVSLGEGARIDMKKYSSKVIWDTWENLLNQIVKQ